MDEIINPVDNKSTVVKSKYRLRKQFQIHAARKLDTARDLSNLNIHGHSFTVEIVLSAKTLDDGQKVMDVKLLEETLRPLIELFDKSIVVSEKGATELKDNWKPEYMQAIKIVEMTLSPTTENICKLFYEQIDKAFTKRVKLEYVRIHESDDDWVEYSETR